MLIDKEIIIDTSHWYNKTKNLFLDCEWIDINHLKINQREFLKRNPDNRKIELEVICDKCGKTFLQQPRCYKEINGKSYCRNCKTSITVSSKECQERTKKTCLERYGVEHTLSAKEVRDKIDKTNIERYGVKNPLQRSEIIEKIRNTYRDKYNVEWGSQLEESKAKSRQTCLEKYGVEHVLSCKEVRDKMEENNLKKYGVRINSQRPEVKEKMIQTNRERYGYDYACQNPKVRQKQLDTLWKKRGKHRMSSQYSRRLAKLLNGKSEVPTLNYILDVYIENDKIDVEYDGGGHDFGVRVYHKITNEELRRKDYYRAKQLKEKCGIKTIRFITPNDVIKDISDKEIIKMYNFAKSVINDTFFIAKIYLEKNKFKCGPIRKTLDEIKR